MFAPLYRRLQDLHRGSYLRLRAHADAKLAARARRRGREPRPPHLLTGERGEDLAFFYLRGQRFTVVARRWRSPRCKGDLDLVAWDGNTLVIFEVKTRTARDLAPAETAVATLLMRRIAVSANPNAPRKHRR